MYLLVHILILLYSMVWQNAQLITPLELLRCSVFLKPTDNVSKIYIVNCSIEITLHAGKKWQFLQADKHIQKAWKIINE